MGFGVCGWFGVGMLGGDLGDILWLFGLWVMAVCWCLLCGLIVLFGLGFGFDFKCGAVVFVTVDYC